MLRAIAHDGLLLWQSPLLTSLGLAHGFTTRPGGASTGAFSGLNLGRATGDDPRAVSANVRRLCAALRRPVCGLRQVSQVHGARVVAAEAAQGGDADERQAPAADGLFGCDGDQLLSVRGADCPCLLLATDDGRWVAALHCGWRGIAAGIVTVGVRQLLEASQATPRSLVAALGPGICANCYEVDGPTLAHFEPSCWSATRPGHGRLDLQRAITGQLGVLGVEQVDVATHCTAETPGLLYSHRRDGSRSGRQMAIIAAKPR